MTPAVARVSSPASFLALVPHLLECTPRRSLVLVPFANGRSLGAMRVDLPPDDPATLESVASTVIGMACKVTDTDAVAAIVYAEDALSAGTTLPHRALIDALLSRAGICGLAVIDALVVGADGWDSYLLPSADGPRPLTEIIVAEPSEPELSLGADQFSAAALPAVDPADMATVARLLTDVDAVRGRPRDRKRLSPSRRADADEVARLLGDPPVLFEKTISGPSVDVGWPRLAAVAFCLERPALRDVALMQWAADLATGDAVLHAQTAFSAGEPFPADLARPMWGEGGRPDADRLRRALDLCRRVAATVAPERRTGALSACAWLAWAQGRSSHAAVYAEAALGIDDQHGLSAIMMSLLDAGRLPEWVFERPTSPGGRGSSRGSRGR